MCAKDNLIKQKSLLQLVEELAIAESITAKDSNHVNIFSLDFAFLFAITILIRLLIARGNISNANILLLIAFIISYCLFADKLVYALNRVIVVLIIILRLIPSTLLAKFISITKIRDLFLKTLKNAAKSRILLICANRRIRQYYLTILLLTSIKKNYYYTPTDTLHLLLKGLVIKMLDFMQDILKRFNNKRAFIELIAVISLLFISKAPFALHFICAVYDLVILAQYKNIRMYRALDSICTRVNSKAYYITIVKQFYSIINKKDEVAVNIAISNFIYAVVLYLILIIIDYTYYDKDRKHIAYIRAFSKVLLFNNNRQINNTTRMLSMPFKFYNLSTIICLVHLVLRDLPNLITYTTMSYYINNYIN
ncbi:hypothetical protein HBH98_250970 [Parastagonospora nodorum]|nr:hypothetical protein HBH98_250970 [Parastagonospora nodorum]KAH4354589.1 hypothetical protein HBH97_245870 [Parastagonospora nodorum]KAH4400817.1 hypothetical protein HBH99_090200 [Parastagonospora nodorum]